MRGVPRERCAISRAPSASSVTPRISAARARIEASSSGDVVVEPRDEAEAVAQRTGDEAGARGRADEREAREVEPDRARRRALADHDVELEVLHRGIEHFLDRPRQAVHLVDEQHVAVVEVREDRGEVAGALERGPARRLDARPHLGRDDPGERGLAESGRTGEQHVVDGLTALLRRVQHDLQVLAQAGLADELVEAPRPQRRLLGRLDRIGRRAAELVAHELVSHRAPASRRSASRSSSSTAPSSGSCPSTSRTSSGE